jgi:hypothetical protein
MRNDAQLREVFNATFEALPSGVRSNLMAEWKFNRDAMLKWLWENAAALRL